MPARLLLILSAPIDARSAAATIARAREKADRPQAVRFALPQALFGYIGTPPEGAEILFYDAASGLESLLPLLTDETHFLILTGAHAFHGKWDQFLLRTLRSLGKRALLTATITPSSVPSTEPVTMENAPTIRASLASMRQAIPELQKRRQIVPAEKAAASEPECCLPALKQSLGEDSVAIGRGLALVCADHPVKTLVIDPALLMGPISFLHDATLSADTLSLAAYITGYSVHALHEAVLWPLADPPLRQLVRPSQEALPGSTLSRFEQLMGFRYGQHHSTGKASMGLFIPEDTYPQRMPAKLLLNQKAKAARMRLKETLMPLLVSAFTDLPSAANSPAFYTLRFGFLRRIESLPLLLYTGGSQERALRASFPNTLSYPDNGLLPRTLLQQGMQPQEHFARSKPLLMLRAAKKQVEFTHVAWVDMDTLPHPICAEAVPDFQSMMDDRIHMATVNGVPDASFILIPVKYLSVIARETASITQLDAELNRGFSETLLWERLFQKRPDWFAFHRMPRRRLLFLSAFDPQFLSRSLRPLLTDLPPVHYAALEDAAPIKRPSVKEMNFFD